MNEHFSTVLNYVFSASSSEAFFSHLLIIIYLVFEPIPFLFLFLYVAKKFISTSSYTSCSNIDFYVISREGRNEWCFSNVSIFPFFHISSSLFLPFPFISIFLINPAFTISKFAKIKLENPPLHLPSPHKRKISLTARLSSPSGLFIVSSTMLLLCSVFFSTRVEAEGPSWQPGTSRPRRKRGGKIFPTGCLGYSFINQRQSAYHAERLGSRGPREEGEVLGNLFRSKGLSARFVFVLDSWSSPPISSLRPHPQGCSFYFKSQSNGNKRRDVCAHFREELRLSIQTDWSSLICSRCISSLQPFTVKRCCRFVPV